VKHLLTFVQPRDEWRTQGDYMVLPPRPVPGRLVKSQDTRPGACPWYWQVGEFVRGFRSMEEGVVFLGRVYDLLVKGVEPEEIEDDRRD